jgi:integrase
VKKACLGAAKRAKIGHLTVRDLRWAFGTRLDELNFNDSTTAKFLGHAGHRSVHRYKRGKAILREAVNALEKQNRAKILPLAKKEKALTESKCLKIKSGDKGTNP